MLAIEIVGVHKEFTLPRPIGGILRRPFARRRLQVLSGVDIAIEAGQHWALLGPNGAGKTTLLRILSAAVLPDRGEVRVLGLDVEREPDRVRRQIGVVLQDERSFYHRLTSLANLRFFGALHDLPPARRDERIAILARLLEFECELETPFRLLSTGYRHRLALARALLHDPPVLLMDEPTQGLDPGFAHRTRGLIRKLRHELGKTVLMATHSFEEVGSLADRAALLQGGVITFAGPVPEALGHARVLFALEGS